MTIVKYDTILDLERESDTPDFSTDTLHVLKAGDTSTGTQNFIPSTAFTSAQVIIASPQANGTGAFEIDPNSSVLTGFSSSFTTDLVFGDTVWDGSAAYANVLSITSNTLGIITTTNSSTFASLQKLKPAVLIKDNAGNPIFTVGGKGGVMFDSRGSIILNVLSGRTKGIVFIDVASDGRMRMGHSESIGTSYFEFWHGNTPINLVNVSAADFIMSGIPKIVTAGTGSGGSTALIGQSSGTGDNQTIYLQTANHFDSGSHIQPILDISGKKITFGLIADGSRSWNGLVSETTILTLDTTSAIFVNPVTAPNFYPQPTTSYNAYLEFIGTNNSSPSPWVSGALVSGTLNAVAGEANHIGVVNLKSSASVNSGYQYGTHATAYLIAGTETSEFIFKPVTTANTVIRLGFQDSITSTTPTDGIFLNVSGTTLSGITYAGGSTTSTASTYTITASTWYHGKIVVNAAGTRVDFYLYNAAGTQLWTDNVTATIPTTAGQETGHGIVAYNTAGGSVDLVYMDYMNIVINRTLIR